MPNFRVTALLAALALPFALLAELPPHIELLQPGVKLTLLAEHTALVTPTGIDVDARGRIWTVSCHARFHPQDCAGQKLNVMLVERQTTA